MSDVAHEDHLWTDYAAVEVKWMRNLVKSVLWEVKKKEIKKEREWEKNQHSPEPTLFPRTDHSFSSDKLRGVYQRNKDIKNNLLKAILNPYYE